MYRLYYRDQRKLIVLVNKQLNETIQSLPYRCRLLKLTKRKYNRCERGESASIRFTLPKDRFAKVHFASNLNFPYLCVTIVFDINCEINVISNDLERTIDFIIDKISIQKKFRAKFPRDIDLDERRSLGEYGSIESNYALRRQRHLTIIEN